MSLPTPLEWETVRNIRCTAGNDRNREALLELKRMLVGTYDAETLSGSTVSLSSPWEVIASSNGASVGGDLWSSLSDIVHHNAGTAHSWIHLRQNNFFGAGDHLHLLLDCIGTSFQVMHPFLTRGTKGFNEDGTTTNRPTLAEDAVVQLRSGTTTSGTISTSAAAFPPNWVTDDLILHLQQTADGQHGRVFMFVSGGLTHWFGWQADESGPSNRDWPFWAWWAGRNSSGDDILIADNTFFASVSNNLFRSINNSDDAVACHVSYPTFGNASMTSFAENAFDATRWLAPLWIGSSASPIGVHSVIRDIYWSRNDTNGLRTVIDGQDFRQVSATLVAWPNNLSMEVT